ncbi:acetyltransferase [Vibrio cholerae]|nr:acetyltransferase [Vibrio cholerae]EKF9401182.1 acetyltransferase [Vibrio cholerae]HDI3134788.1 acetyltransferase [Vibrio cholerae]
MVTVVVFEFGVMRCQPLRRALAVFRNTPNPREGKCTN